MNTQSHHQSTSKLETLNEENQRLQKQFAEVLGKLQQVHLVAIGAARNGSQIDNIWLIESTETPYPHPIKNKLTCEPSKNRLGQLVVAFLAWPLPDSVKCDPCALEGGCGRIGTNLLTAVEARQMFEHVLTKCSLEIRDSGDPEEDCTTFGIPTRILQAIYSERIYQEKKWPGNRHTTAEWLLIMQKCMDDANRAWVCRKHDDQALHEIRQVVATGVAAMEQCGSPLRMPLVDCASINSSDRVGKEPIQGSKP